MRTLYTNLYAVQMLPNDLKFDNQYARLESVYYSRVKPTPFESGAHVISINHDLASEMGLNGDLLKQAEWLDFLSGKTIPQNSDPVAMRYSGHQFGHYVPQLGDGRAILLGQVRNQSNHIYDLHLKGAGLTPYSRDGDGRAVLRSSIREYLCGEAMHGLGIPTTRTLCLIGSQDEVYRERIETGAMITRVAPSHVRFGSFELFYYRQEHEYLKPLADHIIHEHYPDLLDGENRYLALLEEVIARTAMLMAQWQAVGFAHGVMNTDNMSILGLTLDYGPYGFMDTYDPGYICNHSDHTGRYAFDKQPQIGLWNLSCLAQALLPLLHDDPNASGELAGDALRQYETIFRQHYLALMRSKLGLTSIQEDDEDLIKHLFEVMQGNQVDYTIFFRSLSDFSITDSTANTVIRDQFISRDSFDAWAKLYSQRLRHEDSDDEIRSAKMNLVNPAYILRNYMAQTAIEKAESGDHSEIERLLEPLKYPYTEKQEYRHYAGHPPEWADQISVSCSS